MRMRFQKKCSQSAVKTVFYADNRRIFLCICKNDIQSARSDWLHFNPVHLQTKTPENAVFSGFWRPRRDSNARRPAQEKNSELTNGQQGVFKKPRQYLKKCLFQGNFGSLLRPPWSIVNLLLRPKCATFLLSATITHFVAQVKDWLFVQRDDSMTKQKHQSRART